ncbi:MAG: ClpXP protease specificity-enhancing factor SspB [Alphaproteobacteria bacterium]|nr:ClpXP protease specificity-enhancing factor SspB [Alphaproteobacteria bacterium]
MLNYTQLIQEAFRGVVQKALLFVKENGLDEDQSLYFSFKTDKVILPDFLRKTYPSEMTIVLENQYRNLEVSEDEFSVDLSFSQRFYTLKIPFSSLIFFSDTGAEVSFEFKELPQENKAPSLETNKEKKPPQKAELIDLKTLRGKKS